MKYVTIKESEEKLQIGKKLHALEETTQLMPKNLEMKFLIFR